jgi:hypothetical protein
MNTLLALTINIPDWLLSFWGGYLTATGIGVALLLIANFKSFGR